MHLQSLELFGFKSFADKTVFNFHQGVTAVVGPNGCGKSNILDAVRWVLGEQSAKSLRGSEMADVIFNGTDNRKPVGFAEVSLTFSDCSAELGIEWHDVRVTRRVYRDGLSEYFLNKTLCRLKDIQGLFAGTGIGRAAYSMMEQGRIDQILSSRPEDRRAVFEEAAGITKYKAQKREALRKLEATEANLLRLGDIIKEVKRQIGSLQRQAGKARRYQALLADLQVLDTHYARAQFDLLQAERERARAAMKRLDEQQHATGREIEDHENQVEEQRRQLEEVDDRINGARLEIQRVQNEIAVQRNRIELNRERDEELAGLIARYEGDIESAETKLAQQENAIHETDLLLQETERLLQSKESELADLTARAAEARNEREEHERNLRGLELAISKAQNRQQDLEEEIASSNERSAATHPRRIEIEKSLGEAREEQRAIELRLATAREKNTEEETALRAFSERLAVAEDDVIQSESELRAKESRLSSAERALAERESRIQILQQLIDEGQGLAQGSQAVLKGLRNPAQILPSILGALAALIEVEEEFISAIEAALGRNLQAIILRDEASVEEIINTLRDEKLGQTALIALEPNEELGMPTEEMLPANAIAWAIDKVRAPADLQALVRRLLGRVAVTRDLAQARDLRKEFSELVISTLNGELISSEGVIYGGKVSEENASAFARKAQVNSLAAERSRFLEEVDTLERGRAEEQRRLESARASRDELQSQEQLMRTEIAANLVRIAELERELHEASRKADAFEWEKKTLDQQLALAAERVHQLKEEGAALAALIEQQTNERNQVEAASESARLRDEDLLERLTELRLAVATERQRHEGLRSQRQPMTVRQAELAELIATRRTEITNYQRRREQQRAENEAAERSIATKTTELVTAEATIASIMNERAARLTEVNAREAELRTSRKALSDLHEARGKEEVRQTQSELKIESLTQHVSRRYQLDLPEFTPDHYAFNKTLRAQLKQRGVEQNAEEPNDTEQLAEIVEQLTRQLDAMGPVNLEAVQEYDDLEERYRFLENQSNDLSNSRRELLDVIARINQTTEKLFAETFAQVRINFREMFTELFGGGRADLSLLDESDALNCGIEISAKPPGKQLQSISLLSGGERTMTAVALLFAIYMVRPSPFCILDEMDAPLDESNINRFIKMLDRFVRQSQFIIITHNKRTIAKADILYGVTMEERGVSKLVGLRLTPPQPISQPDEPTTERAALQQPLDFDGEAETEPNAVATR